MVIKRKLKTILSVLILLGIFSQSVHAQTFNKVLTLWKFGVMGSYITTDNVKLYLIDADKTIEQETSIMMMGLFAERIYFDEFGLSFSLQQASHDLDFEISKANNSSLKASRKMYHAMLRFIAYLNKNRGVGINYSFEASLGYYLHEAQLTSNNFYYFDKASGQSGFVTNFDQKISSNFLSSTFLGKIEYRFATSGIRLSGGIITGGSFDKASFNVPEFQNDGVLGLKETLDKSPIVSLEFYLSY